MRASVKNAHLLRNYHRRLNNSYKSINKSKTFWRCESSDNKRNSGHHLKLREMSLSPKKSNIWSWLILLLVLLGLGQECSANPNWRDNYDFRVTFFEDLLKRPEFIPDHGVFQEKGIFGFTNVQIYPKSNSVFVSAVNNVFKLGTLNFAIQDRHTWSIPQHLVEKCRQSSANPIHCGQYQVKVILLTNGTQENNDIIFVCHTDGETPTCAERQVDNLSKSIKDWSGHGRCPIDPGQNVTAIIASDQHMYIGTVGDRYATKPSIVRLPHGETIHKKPILRTKLDLTWLQLSEPVSFVESFELGPHIYFVFRELAEELQSSCKQNAFVSRIARICMSDHGDRFQMPDRWTSFVKATLVCPVPGPQGTRLFSNIQSTVLDLPADILYATFTTPDNASPGSVICKYKLSDFDAIFRGPFYDRKDGGNPTRFNNSLNCSEYKKGNNHVSFERVSQATEYQMMHKSIIPRRNINLARVDGERWTHLAVDYVPRGNRIHTIFFVATSRGSLRKLHTVQGQTCLLEEIFIDRENIVRLNDLKLAGGVLDHLIATTNFSVLRFSLERCSRHHTHAICTAAQDPYCTWDTRQRRCIAVHRLPQADRDVLPAITSCPKLDIPIDGAWGPWSDWLSCQPITTGKGGGSGGGSPRGCQCRSRACDSPRAQLGGKECEGSRVEIAGCQSWWGGWSDWSSCSRTCGAGLQIRHRECLSSAGVDQKKGACGEGKERDERPCMLTSQCPAKRIQASWGPWSDWSQCAHACTDGQQMRTRVCESTGVRGEVPCNGTTSELRSCTSKCPDMSALSPWTAWLKTVDSEGRQLRFRANCSASTVESAKISAKFLLQERVCKDNKACSETGGASEDPLGSYGDWTEWSQCNKKCGTGRKQRRRDCLHAQCHGKIHIEEAECNEFPCQGFWQCWGDWSSCSTTCGDGLQYRTRLCRDPNGLVVDDCPSAPSKDSRTCNQQPCPPTEGWTTWAAWSECSSMGIRERKRQCLGESKTALSVDQLCEGESLQRKSCSTGLPIYGASNSGEGGGYELMHMIVVGIVTFFGGAVTVVIIVLIIYKYRDSKKSTSSTSSPHNGGTGKLPLSSGKTSGPDVDRYRPDDLDILLDRRSLFYPSTSTAARSSPYRRTNDSPWMRQSATDDSVFLYGTLGGYSSHQPASSTLTSRYDHHVPPPESNPVSFDYPTMPLRLPSHNNQSGMSTFGRSKKPATNNYESTTGVTSDNKSDNAISTVNQYQIQTDLSASKI